MLLSSVPGAAVRTGQRGSKSRLKPRGPWQHGTWKEILTRLATQRPLSLGLLHLPHCARDDNLRPLSGEDDGSKHLGMSRRPIIARRDDGERCPARVALHLGRIAFGPSATAFVGVGPYRQAVHSRGRGPGGMGGGCHIKGIHKGLDDPASVNTGNWHHA